MDFGEMFKFRPERKLMFWLYPKYANKLTSISSYCASQIEKYSSCKSEVIVIGIENEFYPREKNESNENYIFWMGSKNKHKGFSTFIKAMKLIWEEFPDQKVKIAGGYEYNDNRLKYITIRGNLNYLAEIYSNAKLFVCSSTAEGFGLPALEAMACGCPVITTDTGGSREYAINNENSIVVPPNNPEDLAKGILKLLKDEKLCSEFSKKGLDKAKIFNWADAHKQLNQTIIDTYNEE